MLTVFFKNKNKNTCFLLGHPQEGLIFKSGGCAHLKEHIFPTHERIFHSREERRPLPRARVSLAPSGVGSSFRILLSAVMAACV